MSLYGSRTGNKSLGDPIPLHLENEAEWKAKMEVKFLARQLLDIVTGVETRPELLNDLLYEDPIDGTNLIIDFEGTHNGSRGH